MLSQLFDGFCRHLPAQCGICHAWPSTAICQACLQRFDRARARCLTCALPVPAHQERCASCLQLGADLDACCAALDYGYPWDALITRFKFAPDPAWAEVFAQLMLNAPGARSTVARAHLLVAVPLSQARLRERGFNQAHELARRLHPVKVRGQLLLRQRDTLAQSGLDKAERSRNLEGALRVNDIKRHELRGRRVLLIDDVMTTGATLSAAARILRAAGAVEVAALVLARTP
jgi:ComF family protein